MKLEAIFFDFDGVLVLSEPMHFKAWQIVLKNNSLDVHYLKYEDVLGIADTPIAKKIIKHFSINTSVKDLLNQKMTIYLKESKKPLSYPKGRDEFLNYVKEKGYILAIVSNSSRFEIETILNAQKIQNYFKFIISADDVKAGKPNPEPYQLALSKANISSDKALAIEDSIAGITAAKNANICCYQLNNPKFKQKNMLYFEDFNSLLENFKNNFKNTCY